MNKTKMITNVAGYITICTTVRMCTFEGYHHSAQTLCRLSSALRPG